MPSGTRDLGGQGELVDERAPALAALIVASVEGAIATRRAKRSMRPLDRVQLQLEVLLAGALESMA